MNQSERKITWWIAVVLLLVVIAERLAKYGLHISTIGIEVGFLAILLVRKPKPKNPN